MLTTTGRTFVVSVGDLEGVRPGDVDTLPRLPGRPRDLHHARRQPRASIIRISGGQAFESESTRVYDAETGTITDTDTGIVYTAIEGLFTSAEGDVLTPGFTTSVGFDNYVEVFTGTRYRGSFLRVLVWTIAFSALSVLLSFALGLVLAMMFNDKRMTGRKIYRSLLIIPYALPAFMTALVWRGMLQRDVRHQPVARHRRRLAGDVDPGDVLADPASTCGSATRTCSSCRTGALQSIPTDLKEAAFVDGATGFTAFRKITFPLLLIAVSPLLDRQLRLQLQQLHDGLPAHRRRTAQQRERRHDRHAALVDLPRRPRRRARSARAWPPALSVIIFIIVAVHLGDRVQVHQDVRGGRDDARPTTDGRPDDDRPRPTKVPAARIGVGGGSSPPAGVTSSAWRCWSSPCSRCGS